MTCQRPERRWGKDGSGYKNQHVYDAIMFYGWDNIEHKIIKENLTFDEAQNLEIELINQLDSINNGYNVSNGGGLGGNSWKMFYYNNKWYSPAELLQFSPIKDLTTHDITTRIGHGWDIEETLNKPKTQRNIHFEYNGKLYSAKELEQLSTVTGLTASDIYNRIIKHHWNVERAITQPKNKKLQPCGCRNKDQECLYEYNGKLYKTYELLELSDVDGLTTTDITNRINHHGWSVEDAITKPKKKINQKYLYNGKYYTSKELADLNSDLKVTYHTITDRIRCGWSIDRAVNTPLNTK